MHKKVVEISCDKCGKTLTLDKVTDCPQNWLTLNVKQTGNKGRPMNLVLCPTHSRAVVKVIQ